MAILIRELANGYYDIVSLWPRRRGIRVDIVVTDPDGDTDALVFSWTAPQDYPVIEALDLIVEGIDQLPHVRAIRTGREISIGTASADYSAVVSARIT